MSVIDREVSFERSQARLSPISWSQLRIGIAALLIVAAAAKVQDIVPILAGDGLLASQPLLLTAIGVEAALALYLLIGDRRWSWLLTIALFSVFTAVSGYAWFSGQDCNCIAQRIGPGWMLLIDIAVLTFAWWARPQVTLPPGGSDAVAAGEGRTDERIDHHVATALTTSLAPVILSLIAGTVAATAASWRHQTITASSGEQEGQIEYLIPELLIGKRWPLDSRIDPRLKPLETGRWMVVIVRRDCPHCQEFLDKHFADPTWHRPGERTAVFVAASDDWLYEFDPKRSEFDPDGTISWRESAPFVASPTSLAIGDGIVLGDLVAMKSGEFSGMDLHAILRVLGSVYRHFV